MKTKNILYSVALAATMVACSQEELTLPATNTQDLSDRPLLGDISLVDADIQTRFSTGSGAQPVYENGDKVGAAIIDAVSNASAAAPADRYKIVEYYSSNSAFTRVDGVWKLNSDMPLVEGNYLFYVPYNAAMNARTPLTIAVPFEQDASEEKSALNEFYKSGSVVRVGYQFLASENGKAQKPSLTLNDVFAYPVISITNNFNGYLKSLAGTRSAYEGEIKVDSIQLQVWNASNVAQTDVVVGGVLRHGTNALPSAVTTGVVGKMKSGAAWTVSPFETYTEDLLSSTYTSNRSETANITSLICGRTIASGATEKFYAVMPAMSVNGTSKFLAAKIFATINGKNYVFGTQTLTAAADGTLSHSGEVEGNKFKSAVNSIKLIKGQKYPQEELNFEDGAISSKSSAGSILTIELKGGLTTAAGSSRTVEFAKQFDPTTPTPTAKIANNAQFINFFKDQLNGSALSEGSSISGTTYAFEANTTATINSELINALSKYNNKGSLKLDKPLVIDNDVKVTAIGTSAAAGYVDVTFQSNTNVTYKISLKNSSSNYTAASGVLTSTDGTDVFSVHIMSGAIHTVSANATVGNLRNDGTLIIDASKTLTPVSLVNNETITLNGTIANVITNNGNIDIANATASVSVGAGNGTITLPATVAAAAATVNVLGGTQEGIYVNSFSDTNIEAAEGIAWINAFKTTNTAAFTVNTLSKLVDINKIYATGASFVAGTYDMSGKTLVVEGTLTGISGQGQMTTTVSNLAIVNGTASADVALTNIAVAGTYSTTGTGKITTTSATWNGAPVE